MAGARVRRRSTRTSRRRGIQRKFNEIGNECNHGDAWEAVVQLGDYTGGAAMTGYGGFRLGAAATARAAPMVRALGPRLNPDGTPNAAKARNWLTA